MSAPPVRIESMAWTDNRYQALAYHLGWQDRDVALIKVATIWRWQTEHYTDEAPTYSVPRAVVVGALGLTGPEAIVAADLAEMDPDGRLRIRGGRDAKGKSRIDWLYRERERNRAKGEKRHREADRSGGRFATSRAPAAHQPDVGCSPAGDQPATSSPFSVLRSPDPDSLSLGGSRGPANPAPEPKHFAPVSRLVVIAVDLLNAARIELDPTAQPVDADQGDEMAAAGHLRAIPEDKREAAIRHGVAAIAASIKAGRDTVAALRPGELFGPRSWRKWQAAPTEFTARRRDGPGGRTGQAKPAASHGTGLLDPLRSF